MNNFERANHGGLENQDRRIDHQRRQVARREERKAERKFVEEQIKQSESRLR